MMIITDENGEIRTSMSSLILAINAYAILGFNTDFILTTIFGYDWNIQTKETLEEKLLNLIGKDKKIKNMHDFLFKVKKHHNNTIFENIKVIQEKGFSDFFGCSEAKQGNDGIWDIFYDNDDGFKSVFKVNGNNEFEAVENAYSYISSIEKEEL